MYQTPGPPSPSLNNKRNNNTSNFSNFSTRSLPRRDSFGVYRNLFRSETLTAVSLLIIAMTCLGFSLYCLKSILIPFLIALLLSYLLQPIVSFLAIPPRRWCDKLLGRHGEACCESLQRITRSRREKYHKKKSKSENKIKTKKKNKKKYMIINNNEDDDNIINNKNNNDPTLLLKNNMKKYINYDTDKTNNKNNNFINDNEYDDDFINDNISDDEYADDNDKNKVKLCDNIVLIPRWLAVIFAIGIAIGMIFVVGVITYTSIIHLQKRWPEYEKGSANFSNGLKKWLSYFHYSLDEDIMPYILDQAQAELPNILQDLIGYIKYAFFILIFLIYLLLNTPQPLPPGVWDQIDLHIRRYIRLKTLICLVVGLLVGVIYSLLRVDLAWVFALITFILNFIPNVGPIVATIIPLPIIILDPDLTPYERTLSIILPVFVHMLIGQFLEPKIFGEHFDLHPIVVILSLAFWGVLWDIPGMILSVPIMAIIRIVCIHINHPYANIAVKVFEGRILDIGKDDDDNDENILNNHYIFPMNDSLIDNNNNNNKNSPIIYSNV